MARRRPLGLVPTAVAGYSRFRGANDCHYFLLPHLKVAGHQFRISLLVKAEGLSRGAIQGLKLTAILISDLPALLRLGYHLIRQLDELVIGAPRWLDRLVTASSWNSVKNDIPVVSSASSSQHQSLVSVGVGLKRLGGVNNGRRHRWLEDCTGSFVPRVDDLFNDGGGSDEPLSAQPTLVPSSDCLKELVREALDVSRIVMTDLKQDFGKVWKRRLSRLVSQHLAHSLLCAQTGEADLYGPRVITSEPSEFAIGRVAEHVKAMCAVSNNLPHCDVRAERRIYV